MQLLKNKHVIVAVIVAPVLSILTWFGVGYYVGEKPHAAKQGAYYTLVAKSNCRYESGACTLSNEDVLLRFRAKLLSESLVELTLQSENPLEKILVAFSENGAETEATLMQPESEIPGQWRASLTIGEPAASKFRMAATIDQSTFLVETAALFVYQDKSFRPQE
jgi:hypothetical protein